MEAATPGWSSTVGPYQLIRRLGAGGMGVVYLGHDSRTGAPAAVKLIRPEFAADQTFRARLRREVAAARQVPRFCTAPVLDADLEAERPWVATEYVDGPSLDVVLVERGRLTGAELESLAVGVAVALRAIHEHGVVHRDLKPSNILLSAVGPRVIDFGIARIEDQPHLTQLTHTGLPLGTPVFMAPEQLRGEPTTMAVDVFGWAGLVSYAATGRPAFGTGPDAATAIMYGQPHLGDLPEPVRSLVAAAFHKDPAARPTAAALVEHLTHTGSATTSQVIATAAVSPAYPSGVPLVAGLPAGPPPVAPTAVPTLLPYPAGTVAVAPVAVSPGRQRRGLALAAGSATVAVVLVVALAAGAVAWLNRDPPPFPGDGNGRPPVGAGEPGFDGVFTLGALMPTTGPLADYGVSMITAVEFAVAEINDTGGIWGNPVVLTIENEGPYAEPAIAAAAGDALIAQGVHAIIGGVSSSTSQTVIEAMYHERILMVSPSNTAVEFTDHPFGDYYFRTAASDVLQAGPLAEVAIADGHTTLAILAESTAYGDGLAEAIAEAYQSLGGRVVYHESYPRDTANLTAWVSRLVDADPDALALVSYRTETVEIVPDLIAAGFTAQRKQWFFVDANRSDYSDEFEPGTLAGVKATQPLARSDHTEFLAQVDAFYGGGIPATAFVPEAYDAVMVVALAAIAADSDDPDAIRDHMVDVTTGSSPCATFAECTTLLATGQDIKYSGHSGVNWNGYGEPADSPIGIFQYLDDNTFEQVDLLNGTR